MVVEAKPQIGGFWLRTFVRDCWLDLRVSVR